MSSEQYEYVTVELPTTPWKTRDRDLTAAINQVAEHGWRLVSVLPAYEVVARSYAIFEREKESPDAHRS